MQYNDFSIILRIFENIKLKRNSSLDDYICCLCISIIKDKSTMLYICKNCKKCFCLFQSSTCEGFLIYLSYGWRTCPMCKIKI